MRGVVACAAVAAAAAAPPLGPLNGVYPVVSFSLGLRHCNYVASVCPLEEGNSDFEWDVVAPLLPGAPAGAVSLSPRAFPDHFLSIINATSGAVGAAVSPAAGDATWLFSAPPAAWSNLSDAYAVSSLSSSPAWAGKLLTAATSNTAPCGYSPPAGDVVLTDGAAAGAARVTWIAGRLPPAPPAPAAVVAVDVAVVTNPAVSRRTLGCHLDYGFSQAPRGFTSNLIYGSSFEAGTEAVPSWTQYSRNSSDAAPVSTDFASFSSRPSMSFTLSADGGDNGLRNRGLGGAGLFLVGGNTYDVEVYIWSGATPQAFIELADFTTNTSLARVDFPLVSTGPDWGSVWVRYNFTLTPSASTSCVSIPYGSDPTIDCGNQKGPAHICVRCGGELRLGLSSAGNAKFGFVSLSPGPWGLVRGKDGAPIPILKSAGDVLQQMGVSLIRYGGSVSQSMRWKDWRGPVWARASQQQIWGKSLLSGFGPFEFAALGEALDIETVLTLAYDTNDALDWADLVEYCWGDATTTSWGMRRAADRGGNSRPYNITTFELGNEQYNPYFVEQVAAMEARAKAVGAPPLRYMFPQNGGVNAADAARMLAVVGADVVPRILPDLHVGAGGAVQAAAALFANPPVPGFNTGAINAETNANTHDLKRALDDASDLITWFTYDTAVTDRLFARTASFCSGSSSAWDDWVRLCAPLFPRCAASPRAAPGHRSSVAPLPLFLSFSSGPRHQLLPPKHDLAAAAGLRARDDRGDVGGADGERDTGARRRQPAVCRAAGGRRQDARAARREPGGGRAARQRHPGVGRGRRAHVLAVDARRRRL